MDQGSLSGQRPHGKQPVTFQEWEEERELELEQLDEREEEKEEEQGEEKEEEEEEEYEYDKDEDDAEAHADTVKLLQPWKRNSSGLLVTSFTLFLWTALFALGIWLVAAPIALPNTQTVFNNVSLKNFNVFMTVMGTIATSLSSAAIAVGVTSHLSRHLVSGGITIAEYERWGAVAQGSSVSISCLKDLIPLLMFGLAAGASSALNGIFAAGTGDVNYNFSINYTSIANAQSILSGTPLQNRKDFDGFVFGFHQQILTAGPYNETVSELDGSAATLAGGIAPVIYPVSTFTTNVLDPTGQGAGLSSKTQQVIYAGTSNTYTLDAPTALADFTCGAGTMTISLEAAAAGDTFVSFTVTDPVCGAQTNVYSNTNTARVSAYACTSTTGQAHVAYYAFNANASTFSPLATCTGSVYLGTAQGISYADSQVGNGAAYTVGTPFQLKNATEYSSLAMDLLVSSWTSTFGTVGSASLTELLGTPKYARDIGVLTGSDYYSAIEALTEGLASMTLAKLLNSVAIEANIAAATNTTYISIMNIPYSTSIQAPCLLVGPPDLNKLWLIVLGLSLIAVAIALRSVTLHRPTPMDPLDPLGVLLVAQNSPPAHAADGGCTGNLDKIRSPDEIITYRAVNNRHLALVWGKSDYQPPIVGHHYG